MMRPEDEIILTALALGELEGDEKARAEALLESNEEARRYFTELRALAEVLGEGFATTELEGLDDRRRAEVEAAALGLDTEKAAPLGRSFRFDARPLAAAAALLLAVGGAMSFGLGDRREANAPREVAARDLDRPEQRNERALVLRRDRAELGTATEKPMDGRYAESVGADVELAKRKLSTAVVAAEEVQRRQVADAKIDELKSADPNVQAVLGGLGRAGGATAPGASSGGFTPASSGSPGAGPAGNVLVMTPGATEAGRGPGSPATPVQPGGSGDPNSTTFRMPPGQGDSFVGFVGSPNAAPPPAKAPTPGGGGYVGPVADARTGERTKTEALDRFGSAVAGSTIVADCDIEAVEERRKMRHDEVDLPGHGSESYAGVVEEPFKMALHDSLSTIGLDVDTASYANLRRFLRQGQWPPRDAVRVDEMLNYFHYSDRAPEGEEALAIHAEVAACPWNLEHRLLRVAMKAKEIPRDARGATNLVFLIDVSGSMRDANKLPLLVEGLKALTRELGEDDSVAIVTYASGVNLRLEPTHGDSQSKILGVLDSLAAGGSTNGAGGIQMAYEVAAKAFVEGGSNRVILCTDGDFNVGVSDNGQLGDMITEKAKGGVFLSVLGFGGGNLKDERMQNLANKGNGHYAYIDSKREAEKVLVEELCGTLITVAKDAKLQIEFNPAVVESWRLLGYSARILQAQDFNDDKLDAGEIGAGHAVVALYEIAPTGGAAKETPSVDPLKYRAQPKIENQGQPGEIGTVKIRYKLPEAEKSRLRSVVVIDEGRHYSQASTDFKLSASVALFGQLMFRSPYVAGASLEAAAELARECVEPELDPSGLRRELVELIDVATALMKGQPQR